MSSTTASSTAILETVDGFLHHHVKEEPDWDTVVKICDECQSAADRTHLVINSLLENLKDVKSTPEILYNSLVLLDALVKNVSYSRIVVSTKDVCKIMEKTAKLQEKADVAKKIAKSATKTKESATFSLIYSIPSSSADFGKWAPDDKAMRMIQSWGMLHPAEFPLYLKSVEKWKKAGVVFPAADPEDLVPLPKALSALTSMETNTSSSSSSPSRSIFSLTSPKQKVEKTPGTPLSRTIFSLTSPKMKPGSSASASSKSDTSASSPRHRPKFLMASQRLMNAANNASSLLLDMCSNIGEEGFTVDPDVVESCVNKCKEFAPKLSAFIEALLNEADVVMELSETKRELTLNSLLYSKDQVDSAIKLARDIKKGNYDTNPLKRTVKVYDSEHKKEKTKGEKVKGEKVKDEKVKSEKTKSEKPKESGEQIIDFFAVSDNNVVNNNVTTSSSSLPPSPAQPPLLSMMIASPPQNVGGSSDQLDFFGNNNQNSTNKTNGNDDFDFFSNSDSSPSTSSLSNMSSPQQLYSLSSVSSPQQPHLPTGNSFLDQLLGEYSVPSPLTFAKPAQPQPQHQLQSPPQPQHHHPFQSPPQPLHQTQTQTQNTEDNFDFFKV